MLPFKIKVLLVINASFILLVLLLDSFRGSTFRLRRRPTGRHRRHDTPSMELQRLRRKPTQFHHGAPLPPTRIV
jgi:hypothetical protein